MATLDQSYDKSNSNNAKLLRFSTNTNVKIAQKFIPSVTGEVDNINLELTKTGSPTGNMWVEIWTDSSNPSSITGSASDNVDVSTISASTGSWKNFSWSSGHPSLTASTGYWIVITGDQAFAHPTYADYINVRYDNSSPTYANGHWSIFNGTSWTSDTNVDVVFEQYTLDAVSFVPKITIIT